MDKPMNGQQCPTLVVTQPPILLRVPQRQLYREAGRIDLDVRLGRQVAINTDQQDGITLSRDDHHPYWVSDLPQPHLAPDHTQPLSLAVDYDRELDDRLRMQQGGQLPFLPLLAGRP